MAAKGSARSANREAVLAARRASCALACKAVCSSQADVATKRTALSALVRYATPKGVQRPGDLRTPGVAELDAPKPAQGAIHHEHVVPVRLLVDRMIAGDDPGQVIDAAVVAHVTRVEHQQIGTLVQVHAELYEQMKTAELGSLYGLARRRYTDRGLELAPIPEVIDSSSELDVED